MPVHGSGCGMSNFSESHFCIRSNHMDFSPISEYIADQLYKKPTHKESTILIANKFISNIIEYLSKKEPGYTIEISSYLYRIAETQSTEYQPSVAYSTILSQEKKILKSIRQILESCCICYRIFSIIEAYNKFYIQKYPFPIVFNITNSEEIYNRIIKFITDEEYRISIQKESSEISESNKKQVQQEIDKKNKMKDDEYNNLNNSISIDELCWIKANTLYNAYKIESELPSSEISSDDILLFKRNINNYDRKEIVKSFHDELYAIKSNNPEKLELKTSPQFVILKWELFSKIIDTIENNNMLDMLFINKVSNQ